MDKVWGYVLVNPHRVVAVAVALVGVAAAFGFELTGEQQASLVALMVALVGGSELARTQTTPLSRPRDKRGVTLTPVDEE